MDKNDIFSTYFWGRVAVNVTFASQHLAGAHGLSMAEFKAVVKALKLEFAPGTAVEASRWLSRCLRELPDQ